MISWLWLIPAAVVGGGLGILALAICTAGSSADDWSDVKREILLWFGGMALFLVGLLLLMMLGGANGVS